MPTPSRAPYTRIKATNKQMYRQSQLYFHTIRLLSKTCYMFRLIYKAIVRHGNHKSSIDESGSKRM
jgi:hypothetical protein